MQNLGYSIIILISVFRKGNYVVIYNKRRFTLILTMISGKLVLNFNFVTSPAFKGHERSNYQDWNKVAGTEMHTNV